MRFVSSQVWQALDHNTKLGSYKFLWVSIVKLFSVFIPKALTSLAEAWMNLKIFFNVIEKGTLCWKGETMVEEIGG